MKRVCPLALSAALAAPGTFLGAPPGTARRTRRIATPRGGPPCTPPTAAPASYVQKRLPWDSRACAGSTRSRTGSSGRGCATAPGAQASGWPATNSKGGRTWWGTAGAARGAVRQGRRRTRAARAPGCGASRPRHARQHLQPARAGGGTRAAPVVTGTPAETGTAGGHHREVEHGADQRARHAWERLVGGDKVIIRMNRPGNPETPLVESTRLLHKLLCIGARNPSVQGVIRTLYGPVHVHCQ